MTQSGLDLDKLKAVHLQREAELERLATAAKKEALRSATRQKKQRAIAGRGKAWANISSEPDFFPYPTFTLDAPFLIWPTPSIDVESSIAPFNSWAKFRFLSSASGTQKVSFYFLWVNPYTDYAVINAATSFSANGYLRAHAPWTIGVNESQIYAYAWFGLWFGNFGSLDDTDYASYYLGATGAYGETTEGGDVESTTISAGVSLDRSLVAVPPGTDLVFEVALAVEYDNDSGNIEADFANGDFQIACPVVVFSLLNSPPGPAGGGVSRAGSLR